ncbi:MAG: carboxyl transferase domain-containing protein [Acidimicrobiales bacterium]
MYAWPAAEIGFMDPDVGLNVAFTARLAAMDPADAERQRLIAEIGESTSPCEAVETLKVDEVIDPATPGGSSSMTSANSRHGVSHHPRNVLSATGPPSERTQAPNH